MLIPPLRRTNDIVGQTLLVAFFVIAGATPLLIVFLSVMNFVRNAPRRVAITLKAIGALIIWSILTFTSIMVFIMIVFSYPVPSEADSLKLNAVFALQSLIYLVIGVVLVYWMKRQSRRLPAN